MPFPIPVTYASTAQDIIRDVEKREQSPPSFFAAQSQVLLLAANYFSKDRLKTSKSAVADKHRHRLQNAALGQIMAAFEFCLKDFIAQLIDATDMYDEEVVAAKWIDIDKSQILAQRSYPGRTGAMLIHHLTGWQKTEIINDRYESLFKYRLIPPDAAKTLSDLWIIRHTVAHNAGFLTHHDAYRLGEVALREKTIGIDAEYLEQTVAFLRSIISAMGGALGLRVRQRWMKEKSVGEFEIDRESYRRILRIGTYVESRVRDLPDLTEAAYLADRATVLQP